MFSLLLPSRKTCLWRFTCSSSFFNWEIRSLIRRLSISNFFSPGPLVPIPPPSLDIEFPSPVKRAALYRSCANSTCIFPSLVFALAAKISKITIVLSMILHCNSLSRLLICDGDSSSSQTIPVAPYPSIIMRISSSFPVPT